MLQASPGTDILAIELQGSVSRGQHLETLPARRTSGRTGSVATFSLVSPAEHRFAELLMFLAFVEFTFQQLPTVLVRRRVLDVSLGLQ